MTKDVCRLCGGVELGRLPYYYTLGEKRIYGARCRRCGLVTVSPMPTKRELAALYGGEYFEGDYHCGHAESYEDQPLVEYHRRVITSFQGLKPKGRMLEVGAAGGRFLLEAGSRGYDVFGVELSPEACEIGKKLGIELFCGELHDAGFADGSFDLAYLGDVLEHIPEPDETLSELARILAPGGVLGLSCPTNIDLISTRVGLLAYRLLGRERKAPLPPYHIFEFTPRHLKAMLGKAGFRVVRAEVEIIPPSEINLRGSLIERLGKAALHWPNYIITKLTGLMGDRVTIFAVRK